MQNGGDHSRARLAPKEAAAVIGVSVSTLGVWRQKEIGPRWRKSETNRIYYIRTDIDEWERRYFGD